MTPQPLPRCIRRARQGVVIVMMALAAASAASTVLAAQRGGWRDEGRGYGRDDGERGRPRDFPGRRGGDRFDPRPPAYMPLPDRGWRRGEYLPPIYRGGILADPGRFRLRTPPPGYDWVGVGPDIYLMQRGTGMVLEVLPGGF